LGACWNHFADDLIGSREADQKIYARFASVLEIPAYIAPVAIIAIGVPKFIPPEPARMAIDQLLLRRVANSVKHGISYSAMSAVGQG
jgi:hypothetical protein